MLQLYSKCVLLVFGFDFLLPLLLSRPFASTSFGRTTDDSLYHGTPTYFSCYFLLPSILAVHSSLSLFPATRCHPFRSYAASSPPCLLAQFGVSPIISLSAVSARPGLDLIAVHSLFRPGRVSPFLLSPKRLALQRRSFASLGWPCSVDGPNIG